MKKTNTPKKPLSLSSETIRSLAETELRETGGGSGTVNSCPWTLCCPPSYHCQQ